MKKIKISGKLSLNKTTVAKLNPEEQGAIVGGGTKKTATGPGVCTAMPTLFCCGPVETLTAGGVCTARETLFCCDKG